MRYHAFILVKWIFLLFKFMQPRIFVQQEKKLYGECVVYRYTTAGKHVFFGYLKK